MGSSAEIKCKQSSGVCDKSTVGNQSVQRQTRSRFCLFIRLHIQTAFIPGSGLKLKFEVEFKVTCLLTAFASLFSYVGKNKPFCSPVIHVLLLPFLLGCSYFGLSFELLDGNGNESFWALANTPTRMAKCVEWEQENGENRACYCLSSSFEN